MATSAPSNTNSITIRVLVATTGVTYRISLHPSELTVSNIRGHLAAAVPPDDQILLLGPPYKVPKDATLQNEEVLNALRLGDAEDNDRPPVAVEQQQQPSSVPVASAAQTTTAVTKDADTTSTATATSTVEERPDTSISATGADSSKKPKSNRKLLAHTTSERSGARRLFLFSKQALSEQAPDPASCQLHPMHLELPNEAPGPSPLNLPQQTTQQPLHQALAAYERQFMLYLAQGRVLADGADLRLASLRQCVQEQAVLCRALRAAVSNLSDHYGAAARTRAEFSVAFTSKTSNHANLLQKFESILNQELSGIPLHPALVDIARASGRTMHTLQDTVPVDKERAWAQQCSHSHQRLVNLYRELETAFGELGTTADRQNEVRNDLEHENQVDALWTEVETTASEICAAQAQRLEQLTSGHMEVVKVITNALNSNVNELQNAFAPLQEMSSSTKDLVPDMTEDDNKLAKLMERVANAKTEAMKRMKVRLREVSVAQSSIQRVLGSVGVLRDALNQQTENMLHLEHVAELSHSYRQFLSEIQRRRAYGKAVSSSSVAMMERLASMRADEVKCREKFLRGPGRHLMPAFFDTFVPTLATPPPLFTPQLPAMVEIDSLPDVSDAVVGTPAAAAVGGGDDSASLSEMQQSAVPTGHGSASTLTVSAADQQQGMAGSSEKQQQQQQQQNQQDQLIVSADEASGTEDLILDPAADAAAAAAADAEVKTLAYENAVLRQAVERLGGKSPRAYVEESRAKDSSKPGAIVEEAELAALRKELTEAKSQAQASKEALNAFKAKAANEASGLSDKISHSSFEVGDVGLFMPTGRGSGGKRTYVAFHTNCPHRYLSTDCVKGTPDFVLGRIVYQEELVAGEIGTDANPYGLLVGTPFHVLTVEVLNPSSKSSKSHD